MSIDVLIRAGAAYSMDGRHTVHRAVAIEGERIAAVSPDPRGLDDLVTPHTRVLDQPGLTLLPAFFDNHNHLGEASLNSLFVGVGNDPSIPLPLDMDLRQLSWRICTLVAGRAPETQN